MKSVVYFKKAKSLPSPWNNILMPFDLKNIWARQEQDKFTHFQMVKIFTFPNGKKFAISNGISLKKTSYKISTVEVICSGL